MNSNNYIDIMMNLKNFDIRIDYKHICERLCIGDFDDVLDYIRLNTHELIELDNLVAYRLFLNNLNYSIYHYILFFYDFALTECCYDNTFLMHGKFDRDNFEKTIIEILKTYRNKLDDLSIAIYNPMIRDIITYIKENIKEDIKLDDLSKKYHENKNLISREFRKATGQSINSYIADYRINLAKIKLISTNDSLDQISEDCGFNSSTYFSTTFSKKLGVSPGKYREEHKPK